MSNKPQYVSLSSMDEMMERFERMQARTVEKEWSTVWWSNRAAKPQVRTNLSHESANDLRDWCNSLKFAIVCVMRTDQLQSVLK